MSRPILEVTLRFGDGKVYSGRGRNLPATIENIYNNALRPAARKYVNLMEQFKSGYLNKGEKRYEGTFHATFCEHGGDPNKEPVVVVEVRSTAK